jgi:hypothetical protein
MKERIEALRNKFQVLNFFTDMEIEELLSVVRSESLASSKRPQEILSNWDKAWQSKVGHC